MHGNLAAHLGDAFPDACEADAALAFFDGFGGLSPVEGGGVIWGCGVCYLDAQSAPLLQLRVWCMRATGFRDDLPQGPQSMSYGWLNCR